MGTRVESRGSRTVRQVSNRLRDESLLDRRFETAGAGKPDDTAELGAFHGTGRSALGCVTQTLAQDHEPMDRSIQRIGLGGQPLTFDSRLPIWREHLGDFVEGESGRASKRDQGKLLQHTGIEQAPQASTADRRDQPLFLVVS